MMFTQEKDGNVVEINDDGRVLLKTQENPSGTATWVEFPLCAEALSRVILALEIGTRDRIAVIDRALKTEKNIFNKGE